MKTRARPRQLADGRWLQAVLRGRSTVGRAASAGYCADHADTPHATAAAADACWRKYLLEQTLRLDGTRDDARRGPCKVCGVITNRTIVINGYPRDHWCDEHRTVELVTAWWNAPREAAA